MSVWLNWSDVGVNRICLIVGELDTGVVNVILLLRLVLSRLKTLQRHICFSGALVVHLLVLDLLTNTFFSTYFLSLLWWQQAKRSNPDIPLCSHFLLLLLVDLKAFFLMRYVIPTSMFWVCYKASSQLCMENINRETSRRHLDQMASPLKLIWVQCSSILLFLVPELITLYLKASPHTLRGKLHSPA